MLSFFCSAEHSQVSGGGGAGTGGPQPPPPHMHPLPPAPVKRCPGCFVQPPDDCESLLPSDSGCVHPCWARSDKGVKVLISIICYNTANAELVPAFLQGGCGTFKGPGPI